MSTAEEWYGISESSTLNETAGELAGSEDPSLELGGKSFGDIKVHRTYSS